MQNDVTVSDGNISGDLYELTEGALAHDWGAGHFLALKFATDDATITSIKVGLDPSVSSGMVELDSDMDGVFKITMPDIQKFIVEYTDGTTTQRDYYTLSGLNFNASA